MAAKSGRRCRFWLGKFVIQNPLKEKNASLVKENKDFVKKKRVPLAHFGVNNTILLFESLNFSI